MATKLRPFGLRIIVLSLFALTIIGLANFANSSSNGVTGVSTSGCSCHCNAANGATTVAITTSATVFEPGQTYNFTVTVSHATLASAGVNISASSGTLTAGSDGLQRVGTELTHTAPKNLNASWSFTYTVPTTGTTATIFAAGNAVDGTNGNNGGNCTDKWNTTSYPITIAQRGVALTRSNIAFGTRKVGSGAVSDTLRIVSTGDLALTVSSSAMKTTAPFSASPTGTNRTINAGEQETNTITFTPLTRGTFVDTFVVNNNSSVANDQRKTVIVTGTAIQAVFSGNTSLAFGNVDINTTKDLQYTIQNTGDDTLFLNTTTPASVTGAGFTILTPPATTILPAASTNMTVRFSPTVKQAYTGTLTFSTLGGIGSPTVALSGNGAAPQIQVANFVDAGSTKVNVQTFATLNVTNSGNSPLQVTSVVLGGQDAGRFNIQGQTNFTIQPTQTQAVSVGYTPNVEGRDTAQITVNSNDQQNPVKTIAVFGRGVTPKMSVTPDSVDFGDVRVGSSLIKNTISINNPGEVTLAVTNVTVTGTGFSLENKPNQIQAGGTGQVSIKYTPTTEGAATGIAIISGDSPSTPSDTVYLKARGTKSQINAPTAINFGSIRINQTKDSTLKIENLGTASVTIRKYALTDPDDGFRLTDTTAHTINPNGSINIKVRFRPTAEKNYTGAIVITTEEASNNTITINLSGNGIDSKLLVEPTTLDFGEIDTMKTAPDKTFTIRNTGTAPATINNIVRTGSDAFSMTVGVTSPFVLAPDSLVTVTVGFAPKLVQPESGTITVTASEGSPIDVLLSGSGKAVPLESVKDRPNFRFSMAITPNPARENVTLSLTSEREARITVVVTDMNGKTALTTTERAAQGKSIMTLGAKQLAQGMYIVRAYENGILLAEENMAVIR
jgi:large repetitive protein